MRQFIICLLKQCQWKEWPKAPLFQKGSGFECSPLFHETFYLLPSRAEMLRVILNTRGGTSRPKLSSSFLGLARAFLNEETCFRCKLSFSCDQALNLLLRHVERFSVQAYLFGACVEFRSGPLSSRLDSLDLYITFASATAIADGDDIFNKPEIGAGNDGGI